MQVIAYGPELAEKWDEVAANCPMATFLHTRRFLSYHGDRFRDVSVLINDDRQRIIALFPAAIDPNDARRVVSHPGITFGGLIHPNTLRGEQTIEALELLIEHYSQSGFSVLRYKAVPHIYHKIPSGDDLYALYRLGASRYRCELSSSIELAARVTPSERRRRGLKKANANGIRIEEGVEHAEKFWAVLEESLQSKYGASPVHSYAEISRLFALFPEQIRFVTAFRDSELVAGVVLFASARVVRMQYSAASEVGYTLCAIDAVMEHCIQQAVASGAKYFDFGTSNEDEGRRLNSSLYQFKSEFGGGGVAYESYELNLKAITP